MFIGKEAVRLSFLAERVRQLLVNRSDKSVFLRIDGQLTVQDQLRVGDQLTKGGAERMGVTTEPIPDR